MIKGLLFGLITMLVLAASGQDLSDSSLNQLDDQGRKQGYWKEYNENGKLKYEGTFINGHPVDTFLYYYPSGRIRAISIMKDSGKRSMTRIFHENGRLMGEGNFRNQLKDSTWMYYSDIDGALLSKEFYIKGKRDSIVTNYYPTGELAETITYRNGIKAGPWKQFFPDGKLKLKATYVNDLLEGSMVVYHPNGVPQISGIYKHNLKDGLWMHFDENGNVLRKEIYKNGQLEEAEDY